MNHFSTCLSYPRPPSVLLLEVMNHFSTGFIAMALSRPVRIAVTSDESLLYHSFTPPLKTQADN